MKRLNPATNKPFKHGDVREDGYVFRNYDKSKPVRKNGTYQESWFSPEAFENEKTRKNKHDKVYYENNKEKVLCQRKEHYKNNKEKISIQKKEHYKNNKEKVKVKNKKYYQNNKEKIRAENKTYRKNNKEKVKDINKKYYENNKEMYFAKDAKRRAIKNSPRNKMLSELFKEEITALFAKAEQLARDTGIPHHVHHYIPLALGGTNSISNLYVIPATWNLQIGSKDPNNLTSKEDLNLRDQILNYACN